MRYNDFKGMGRASRLGYGLMRLPVRDGQVEEERAIRLIRRGIDGGITYIDTAYPYHGGQSEVVAGKALKDGYREKVTITDKLPCWAVKESGDMDALLDEQLRRLDLPYIDMYLLHALNRDRYAKMKELGFKDFFRRALKDGRIRHVGFSFHDGADAFREILDDYDGWEMCQIQYNYLDDDSQATEQGLLYAGKKNVPVVIMEPLRGGNLARVPREIAEKMDGYPVKRSPAEWAFRFAADHEEVKVVLSGMSSEEQLEDNLRIFDGIPPRSLTEEDLRFVKEIKQAFLARQPILCTGCRYCQPCPRGVKIPEIFEAVNRAVMFDRTEELARRLDNFRNEEAGPSRCVKCGKCESVCPQGLKIIELLKKTESGGFQVGV